MSEGTGVEPLILIVSGPSGSGKRRWCRRFWSCRGPCLRYHVLPGRGGRPRPPENAMISSLRRSFTPWWPGANFWNTRRFLASIPTGRRRSGWRKSRRGIGSGTGDRRTGRAAGEAKVAGIGGDLYTCHPRAKNWNAGLRSRGQDADEEIARRLAKAHDELWRARSFTIFV